ncbi:MAG: hypothetical protein M1832_000603 [Thelocarpon impressellum]|nr:MAG: hypothetical protein M1832_000603 [Thelocarpon impressellum]
MDPPTRSNRSSAPSPDLEIIDAPAGRPNFDPFAYDGEELGSPRSPLYVPGLTPEPQFGSAEPIIDEGVSDGSYDPYSSGDEALRRESGEVNGHGCDESDEFTEDETDQAAELESDDDGSDESGEDGRHGSDEANEPGEHDGREVDESKTHEDKSKTHEDESKTRQDEQKANDADNEKTDKLDEGKTYASHGQQTDAVAEHDVGEMASGSSSGRQDRGYHQDYITRVRYTNNLPPPDMPPKLLPIPGEGLGSGYYTSPAFAGRMAREEAMNIEADSELGMPLDLVGMPGVFDGDESSIQAPDHTPAPHPDDKPLLRPLSSLGKPTSVDDNISFLRRTEYISSVGGGGRSGQGTPKKKGGRGQGSSQAQKQKQREEDPEKDDPVNILRTIEHSFDVANPQSVYTGPDTGKRFRGHAVTDEEREAWDKPKHPTKKDVYPVEYYPLLPDLDAFPDSGGYIVITFKSSPLNSEVERLEVGLLRPREPQDPKVMQDYQDAVTAHQKDPSAPSPGPPPFNYDLYIPQDAALVASIKKKFDITDPAHDDAALYPGPSKLKGGEGNFRYQRTRTYEPAGGTQPKSKYNEVVVTLYDPPADEAATGKTADGKAAKQKGAYYVPVLQKITLQPKRDPNIASQPGMMGGGPVVEDGDKIDCLEISTQPPTAEEVERRTAFKREVDPESFASDDEWEEGQGAASAAGAAGGAGGAGAADEAMPDA